jgi:anthranilate 1,2-dioxygenase large subunit
MTKHQTIPKKLRSWPKSGPSRVPAWIYTDPDIFEREMSVLFSGPTWNYVGLECEVPEIGSYRKSSVGNKPVIMVRDLNGTINVMENRCSHRGTALCWEERGQSKKITCPYHRWTFDLTGKLIGVPFQDGINGKGGMTDDFARADHNLRRLRVTSRGGAVWATFDDSTPDFETYCGPELLGNIDRLFSGRPLRLMGYSRQLIPCNWKVYWENTRDTYHATLLHTFYVSFGLFRADAAKIRVAALERGEHNAVNATFIGKKASSAENQMERLQSDMQLNDMETVTPRQEFPEQAAHGLQVFPSAFLQTNLNSLLTRQIVPKSPETVELVWTYFGFADDDEDMKRLRLKQANLVGPAGYVSMDDSEVLSQVQRVVANYPETEGVLEMGGLGTDAGEGDTMLTETQLRAFYEFYRDVMAL